MKILWLIILAVIQGITEFLPVSSSGHIVLFGALLKNSIDSTLIFNAAILLHGGSLIAVVLFYRKKLGLLIHDFFSVIAAFIKNNKYNQNSASAIGNNNEFKIKKLTNINNCTGTNTENIFNEPAYGNSVCAALSNNKFTDKTDTMANQNSDRKKSLKYIAYLLLSTSITFGVYLLFNNAIEAQFSSPNYLFIYFLITTLLLFLTAFIRSFYKKNNSFELTAITDKKAVFPIIVGLFQGLALFPGVSRSGATICSSLYQNIKPEEAAEFSFLLFVIAETAALFIEIKNYSFQLPFSAVEIGVMVAASCFVSLICLVILKKILQKNKLFGFGFYTLIAAVVSFILFR